MLYTERLTVRPASDEELRALIDAEPVEEMKTAYREMLAGCLKHPERRQWYTIWRIDTRDGTHIGDLCFKGVSADGSTELGYGILPEYQGRGYATEAAAAAVSWALRQPGIVSVEAETDSGNIASQRVLEKLGFTATGQLGEEGPRFAIRADG